MKLVSTGQITIVDSNDYYAQPNLLKWQTDWGVGNAVIPGWANWGTTNENSRVYASNPWGIQSLMWKCVPGTDGGASGGWSDTSNYYIDQNYAYRYTVFVYRTKNVGYIYHGCHNVLNIDGTVNSNPYFIAAEKTHAIAGSWFLLVGYVHPSSVTQSSGKSGIYDMSGKQLFVGADFKFDSSGKLKVRSLLDGSTDPAGIVYFYNPTLEKLDGTEESLDSILRVSTQEQVNEVKTSLNTYISSNDAQISLLATKTEVNGLDSRLDSAELVVNATGVNAIVKAGEIASQINQTAQSVLIQADKITMQGSTTFVAGVNDLAQAKVDAVQIGGRNLLLNTSLSSTSEPWAGQGCIMYMDSSDKNNNQNSLKAIFATSSNNLATIRIYAFIPSYSITPGEHVISFYAKSDASNTLQIRTSVTVFTFALTTSWKKFAFIAPGTEGNDRIVANLLNAGTLGLNCVKFEKGNKPTEWTPAPEDVDSSILAAQSAADTANTSITKMSSDDSISPVEKPALKKEYDIIVNEVSKYDAQATTYNVSKDTYDAAYIALSAFIGSNLNDLTTFWELGSGGGATLRDRFKSYYIARTDLLNAISAAIKTAAETDATNKVNALQIGGRNFIQQSSFKEFFSTYQFGRGVATLSDNIVELTVTSGQTNSWFGKPVALAADGQTYTMSALVKSSSNTTVQLLTEGFSHSQTFSIGNEWKVISMPFELTASDITYIDIYNFTPGTTLYIRDGVMLENGNKPTGWKESPEDAEARLTAAKDDMAANMGYVDYADLKAKAELGKTIINGGYLNTELIDVETLVASAAFIAQLQAIDIVTSKLTIKTADSGERIEIDSISNSISIKNSNGDTKMKLAPKNVLGSSIYGTTGSPVTLTYPIHSNEIASGTANIGSSETLSLDSDKFYDIVTPVVNFEIGTAGIWTDKYNFLVGTASVMVKLIDVTLNTVVWSEVRNVVSGNSSTNTGYKGSSGTIPAHTVSTRKGSVYRIDVILACDSQGDGVASASIASGQTLSGAPYLNMCEIGYDGYNFGDSASNMHHYSTTEGLIHRGKIDIPGGLGGGSINSTGGIAYFWGKITTADKIVKSGSNYTITHNIGDTNYSIILTPKSTNIPYFLDANRLSNSIVVTCAGGFDFVLIRTQ